MYVCIYVCLCKHVQSHIQVLRINGRGMIQPLWCCSRSSSLVRYTVTYGALFILSQDRAMLLTETMIISYFIGLMLIHTLYLPLYLSISLFLSLSFAVSSGALALVFGLSIGKFFGLLLWVVGVDFIATGLVISTALWYGLE